MIGANWAIACCNSIKKIESTSAREGSSSHFYTVIYSERYFKQGKPIKQHLSSKYVHEIDKLKWQCSVIEPLTPIQNCSLHITVFIHLSTYDNWFRQDRCSLAFIALKFTEKLTFNNVNSRIRFVLVDNGWTSHSFPLEQ